MVSERGYKSRMKNNHEPRSLIQFWLVFLATRAEKTEKPIGTYGFLLDIQR